MRENARKMEGESGLMDVVAVIISLISLVVAGIGTVLANKRAKEAIAESRKAAASALWSGVQEAIQRMIGFDPASEPIGERLANLRISMIALVDEMPDWVGLDEWLEAERALGAVLGREVSERAKRGDTVNERLQILDPYQLWAQALGSNLRYFRAAGYDAKAAAKLRELAESHSKQVSERNGWPPPPAATAALGALDARPALTEGHGAAGGLSDQWPALAKPDGRNVLNAAEGADYS